MLSLRRSEQLSSKVFNVCRKYLSAQNQFAAKLEAYGGAKKEMTEYSENPEYPEILDLSFKGRKASEVEASREEIRAVRTVEEKLIKINMPRYYGYKVAELSDKRLPYNCLPAIQHYTRTLFEENASEAEEKAQAQIDSLVLALKGDVQDALEFTYDYFNYKYENADLKVVQHEKLLTQLIVEQINRCLINLLAADCTHLQEVEVDYNPRHEAFWFVGGIDPPKMTVKRKEGREWQKEMAKDPVDRMMQYIGEPYLAVRHCQQLPAWKSEEDSNNLAFAKENIPLFRYDPRTLGYSTGYQHGTNIPGYWPGSPHGFGCISYQSRANILRPSFYKDEDFNALLHALAIQSSFAWLLAQANYNGFNTFSELTYPMNTQTIITNGRDWSFYEYQLNTLLVHTHHVHENPKINFCRGTAELQLYQEFDDNGKCIGLNEQVLRHLLRVYMNAPSVQRTPAELQPYLDPNFKRIADYANEDQRIFLEHTFKHMCSNRPRHLAIPEIYLWEKIYKIDNKTRQMDAKRRYFELDINPWQRTLDQHDKVYIPRALRPEGEKSKNKFKKTYYP